MTAQELIDAIAELAEKARSIMQHQEAESRARDRIAQEIADHRRYREALCQEQMRRDADFDARCAQLSKTVQQAGAAKWLELIAIKDAAISLQHRAESTVEESENARHAAEALEQLRSVLAVQRGGHL